MQIEFKAGDAVLNTMAHSRTTEKYKFINTNDIVTKFGAYGWTPVKYTEARTRKYKGFQTHCVNLTHGDESVTKVGDSSLRILIVNNHHASKCMEIKLGLYRLVCTNGMVVQDAGIDGVRVRHMGANVDQQIADFVDKIAIAAEQLRNKVAFLQNRVLTTAEKVIFARSALTTRFTADDVTDAMITSVLHVNRPEDDAGTAWTVFNTLQENITQGFDSSDRQRRVRRLTSLKRDMEINEQLWAMLPMAA